MGDCLTTCKPRLSARYFSTRSIGASLKLRTWPLAAGGGPTGIGASVTIPGGTGDGAVCVVPAEACAGRRRRVVSAAEAPVVGRSRVRRRCAGYGRRRVRRRAPVAGGVVPAADEPVAAGVVGRQLLNRGPGRRQHRRHSRRGALGRRRLGRTGGRRRGPRRSARRAKSSPPERRRSSARRAYRGRRAAVVAGADWAKAAPPAKSSVSANARQAADRRVRMDIGLSLRDVRD